MIDTKANEYRELEHESSSQLMEHDSRRALGRYEEAAYHALQAGTGRTRMGQLRAEAGEYVGAVEDGLSAAECFLLASASRQAEDVLTRLRQLEADGKIPADRSDLSEALRDRERELENLKQSREQFLRDFGLQGNPVGVASEHILQSALQRVRELPGHPVLHYVIHRQAWELGRFELAIKHLDWSVKFEPGNANWVAILGYRHIDLGRPVLAVELGIAFLAADPSDAGPVRIMLANALGSGSGHRPPDQERAIEFLQPLVDDMGADECQRIAALALIATFQYELGREEEFGRLVRELDRLEGASQPAELRLAIAELRAMIPHPEVNGAGAARPGLRHLLPEGDRLRLFQKAMQMSVRSVPLAA